MKRKTLAVLGIVLAMLALGMCEMTPNATAQDCGGYGTGFGDYQSCSASYAAPYAASCSGGYSQPVYQSSCSGGYQGYPNFSQPVYSYSQPVYQAPIYSAPVYYPAVRQNWAYQGRSTYGAYRGRSRWVCGPDGCRLQSW